MYNNADKLIKTCIDHDIKISEATLLSVIEDEGLAEEDILRELEDAYDVMVSAATEGLERKVVSMSGMTGGNGKKLADYNKEGISMTSPVMVKAMAMAMSTLEVNASMGKIVAAPTAGAAGILPAALITAQEKLGFSNKEMVYPMLTAAAIGGISAMNATISGAEGGCQAETGTGASMAAAAVTEMMGGTVNQVFHAASIAMINLLGLVCDPIGGLVEFPCALRNASGVSIALTSADLAMAGVESIIPFDEVVDVMFSVGNTLPESLRETALGGLAAAPSAANYCGSCDGGCTG